MTASHDSSSSVTGCRQQQQLLDHHPVLAIREETRSFSQLFFLLCRFIAIDLWMTAMLVHRYHVWFLLDRSLQFLPAGEKHASSIQEVSILFCSVFSLVIWAVIGGMLLAVLRFRLCLCALWYFLAFVHARFSRSTWTSYQCVQK